MGHGQSNRGYELEQIKDYIGRRVFFRKPDWAFVWDGEVSRFSDSGQLVEMTCWGNSYWFPAAELVVLDTDDGANGSSAQA